MRSHSVIVLNFTPPCGQSLGAWIVDQLQETRLAREDTATTHAPAIDSQDSARAEKLLESPDLMESIGRDFETCGMGKRKLRGRGTVSCRRKQGGFQQGSCGGATTTRSMTHMNDSRPEEIRKFNSGSLVVPHSI